MAEIAATYQHQMAKNMTADFMETSVLSRYCMYIYSEWLYIVLLAA